MARHPLAGLLGAAAVAATSVLAAPPALAASCNFNDETPPTISKVSVSDVALTSAGGNSTVLATVTDQPTTYYDFDLGREVTCASGVDLVTVIMYGPTDGYQEQDLTLVSGDEISGRYSATVYFDPQSEPGMWAVSLVADDLEYGFGDEQSFGTITVGPATTPTPPPTGASSLAGVRIKKVNYDTPRPDNGSDRSLRAEWVRLENGARTTRDLYGATIRDRSGHVFRFTEHHRLSPGEIVTVHTGPGAAKRRQLFWDAGDYVWNNRRDRATLKDSTGKPIDRCSWSSPRRDFKIC